MIQSDSTAPYEGFVLAPASGGLTSFEAVYSTADIEREVFYEAVRVSPIAGETNAVMRAVNGELFLIDDETAPPNISPLPEDSPLLRLARE